MFQWLVAVILGFIYLSSLRSLLFHYPRIQGPDDLLSLIFGFRYPSFQCLNDLRSLVAGIVRVNVSMICGPWLLFVLIEYFGDLSSLVSVTLRLNFSMVPGPWLLFSLIGYLDL